MHNDRKVLSRVDRKGHHRWECVCLICGKISTLEAHTIRTYRCRCSIKNRIVVGDKELLVEDLGKLSDASDGTIRRLLRRGLSPLEIILGKRSDPKKT